MRVTETEATVVVMAPVLTVCRYLADAANVARCLPGVVAVRAREQQTLTIRYDGTATRPARIAPGQFRLDHTRQRIEWEIRGSARYSGTIGIYGDSSISRLQSTMRTDERILSGAARDLHVEMLRRFARAVERELNAPAAPVGWHNGSVAERRSSVPDRQRVARAR
jgi:hypothetical protein